MFGVVPKSIWQKLNPADEKNMCNWAMRCLLVEIGNRLILIDTGIGNKQDAKFFSYYYLSGNDSLIKSIEKAGFSKNEVTDVILTHMHFDHVGGAIELDGGAKLQTTFPNAQYWTNEKHWQWATHPNEREKASFLKDNILPIESSGQLRFVNEGTPSPFEGIEFFYANGHTMGQMLPILNLSDGKKLAFVADLFPSQFHVPMPYIMAYDMQPLETLSDKKRFFKKAIEEKISLFFEHDPMAEVGVLQQTELGVKVESTLDLTSWK